MPSRARGYQYASSGIAIVLALTLASTSALASPKPFNIDSEEAPRSLLEFGRQSAMQILFASEKVKGVVTNAVHGNYEPLDALRMLLKGTPLVISEKADGVLVVGPRVTGRNSSTADPVLANGDGRSASLGQSDAVGAQYEPGNPPVSNSFSGSLPASGSDKNGLSEIVVTARKQSERLQDVPMSITALSGATLQASGALTVADIAREVPGLNVVSVGPGQNQLIIRGVSSSGGVPTVGFYIDDTPIESPLNFQAGSAMDPELLDLERVEVLRGPQGTLYGASSMGGTVKYLTTQPDLTLTQGYVKTTLSDTDGGGFNYGVSGLLNEPVIPGYVALRMTAFYRHEDGYIDRYPIDPNNYLGALPGPVTKDVNTEKSYGARISVEIKPSEGFTITPWFWIQRTDSGSPFTIDEPPGNFDYLIQTRDVSEPVTDEMRLAALTIDGNIQALDLTSTTSYRDRLFDAIEDDSKVAYYYFSPVPQSYVYPLGFNNYFGDHDFTEEMRGSASVGPVHGLLGLFYLHTDNYQATNLPIPEGYNAAFGTPFGNQPFYVSYNSSRTVQKAVFGEINVDVTRKLQATVGARVFEVTQTYGTFANGVFNGGLTTGLGASKDNGTNPKFELSYHFTPDLLAYATAAKGFRQGGPLVGLPVSLCDADLKTIGLNGFPSSFKADTLWNYELGAKTAWLDHRLTVNAAVYYIDWTNIQQLIALPTCGYSFTGNFGKATSKGSEVEVQYEPVPALRFTLGAAYNDATLTSTISGAQGQPGDTLENAPRWMGSVSAEYHREIAANISGYARFDFSTTTNQYNNFDKTSNYYNRPGYSLGNVRLGAKYRSWDAALFIENVANKHAETALPQSYAVDLPTTRRLSVNRPRTIGLDLRLDF